MSRLLHFLTALVFLILALPAQAQENDFGLAPLDAEIFRGGIQATQGAASFQFTFTATLELASDAEQVQIGLDGSGTVLPGDNPEFDITLNGTSKNIPDIPAQFTIELRLIDGTLYARATDHTGQATPWEAQPASDLVNGLSTNLDPETSTQLQDAAGVLEAAGQIDLAEFIHVSRPAQEARFVAEFQFRDFFLSPGFASVLGEVLAASDTSTTYTPAQVNAVAAVMTTIFQDPKLNAEFTFGDDQLLQRVMVDVNLNMDASALAEDTPPITAVFQADFQLSGYDQVYTLAVPDGAVAPPTPAAVLLQPIPGKALLPDQPIHIQMTGQGGLDLVYYAAEPGTISIYARSLDNNSIPVDTVLDIYDPGGNSLASNDDLNASSSDAGIENLALPVSGAYRIHLGTFASDETGGVEVQLATGSGLPPPEQANEIAGRIENGQPFEYTFQGQAGQMVTVTAQATNPPSPNLDLALTVYGPDGTQIGFDDDSGAQAGLGDRDAALVNFSLPANGEYRVEVSSYLNINGDFQLRIETGG